MKISSDLYLRVFEKSKTICCVLNVTTLEIIEFNTSFSDAFDIPELKEENLHFTDFLLPEELQTFQLALEDVKSGLKSALKRTMLFSNSSKEMFWGDLDLLDLDLKKPHLAFVSIRDVSKHKTSEKQLLSSEAKYKQLFDHSLNAIGIYDIDKECYVDCNKTFESLYGYSTKELAQLSPLDLAWNKEGDIIYKSRFEENLIRLKANETIRFESEHSSKQGTKIFVDVILIPFFNNGRLNIKQVTTDISNIKKANARLQKSLIKLKEKNEELEHFAYITSHDLKEPLNTIISFTKLIKRDLNENEKASKYLSFVINSGIKLKTMVKNILEYSKLNNQSIAFHEISLLQLIEEVEIDLKSIAQDEPVVFVIDKNVPEIIIGNATYVYQLFQNLLKNAIKFKHPQRKAKIEILYSDLGKYHQFSISDNGIGIKENLLKEIFTIFKKGSSTNSNDGNGIGLAICKKVIELHLGKIWVESKTQEGSTFHFTIQKDLKSND